MKTDFEIILERSGIENSEELLLEMKRKDAGKLLEIAENTLTNAVQTILDLALKPATKKYSFYIETDTFISYFDKNGNKIKVPLCVITDNYPNRKKNKFYNNPPSAGVKHFAQHILTVSDVMYGYMHKRINKYGQQKKTTKTELECFIKAFSELEARLSKNTIIDNTEIQNGKATISFEIPYMDNKIKMVVVIGLPENINTDIAFILTSYQDEP